MSLMSSAGPWRPGHFLQWANDAYPRDDSQQSDARFDREGREESPGPIDNEPGKRGCNDAS
jgi:hypothetical protein